MVSPPITPEKLDRVINIQTPESQPCDKSPLTSIAITPKKLNFNESPYSKAKKLFMRGSSRNPFGDASNFVLTSREKEAELLNNYITESLKTFEPTSLYISGPPGTGKTAQVNAVLDSLIKQDIENANGMDKIHKISKFRISKINCMVVKSSQDIFESIHYDIFKTKTQKKNSIEDLKNVLASNTTMTIIVLDEMDNLINRNQQALFELFSWASNLSDTNPKVILIGIANALDLTDRFLPRLRSNRINPKLIQFLPYSAEQVKSIITWQLNTLVDKPGPITPIVHPAAIQLCSKKSASNTGDLRKAFDILVHAIELLETQTISKLSQNQIDEMTFITAPKVMISHIAKVCNNVFNFNFNEKLKNLNLQNKSVLCSLIKYEELLKFKMSKQGKNISANKRIFSSINSFYDHYSKELNIEKTIGTLKKEDFLEILTSLESGSLVSIDSNAGSKSLKGTGRSGSTNVGHFAVSANIPKLEVLKIVDDIGVLKRILNADVTTM
ncbi:hypothetical protein CANARDRAFT_195523 [[Candida] arabinofermentans NRRL YB-2248]|uniref:Cell division control protein n=1 Tax=[Candida] arabinofermentans NRRL YB-2248 TaxID=983967 RepID=A0A1E4T535_9ASCO|nr:hypothetical protein CANARDRAFT_195523 [[Candida] arabinofermentans NRRL YB-2248]